MVTPDAGKEENFVHSHTGDGDGLGRCEEEEKVSSTAIAIIQQTRRKHTHPQHHPRLTKCYCKESCGVWCPSCTIGYDRSPCSSPTSSPTWSPTLSSTCLLPSHNSSQNVFSFDDFPQEPITPALDTNKDADDDCQDACTMTSVLNRYWFD